MTFFYSSGDVDYDPDNAMVKLTLRRPVHFKVPSEIEESYNPKRRIKAPSSSLNLEWVYGYR